MRRKRITLHRLPILLLVGIVFIPSLACTQESPSDTPASYLEGVVTVHASIDSTGDYSGIEVIITDGNQDGPDTLGFGITDAEGHFSTSVVARERGVFPLVLKRGPNVLSVNQFVVAAGDSAKLTATLPLGQRLPMIRSPENSAWLAFQNAEATHSERIAELFSTGSGAAEDLRRAIELESGVLWSIRETFSGTMAADVAAAKAVVMLDGWNDSLLVVRLRELDPTAPGFVEGVQAGGRAQTRLEGVESGVALLEEMLAMVEEDDDRAAIQREIAQAYLDVRRREDAVAAIQAVKSEHEGTDWEEWADRALYEANNLMPGDPAPHFSLSAVDGTQVDLDSLRGGTIVVDFWSPRDREAPAQLPEIERIVESDGWSSPGGLTWISIALEPDDDLFEAYFEGRDVPGIHVRDQSVLMQDLVALYNVEVVPTRFLIDSDGRIVEKFVGSQALLDLSTTIENLSAE